MRQWRKKHPLEGEALRKKNVRCYARVYVRRGLIQKQPCRDCGSALAELHHPDYSKPLLVVWLCRSCHLELHKREAA
jgi:hypothetical protein